MILILLYVLVPCIQPMPQSSELDFYQRPPYLNNNNSPDNIQQALLQSRQQQIFNAMQNEQSQKHCKQINCFVIYNTQGTQNNQPLSDIIGTSLHAIKPKNSIFNGRNILDGERVDLIIEGNSHITTNLMCPNSEQDFSIVCKVDYSFSNVDCVQEELYSNQTIAWLMEMQNNCPIVDPYPIVQQIGGNKQLFYSEITEQRLDAAHASDFSQNLLGILIMLFLTLIFGFLLGQRFIPDSPKLRAQSVCYETVQHIEIASSKPSTPTKVVLSEPEELMSLIELTEDISPITNSNISSAVSLLYQPVIRLQNQQIEKLQDLYNSNFKSNNKSSQESSSNIQFLDNNSEVVLSQKYSAVLELLDDGHFHRKFEIVKMLGKGGQGSVFQVKHKLDLQYYAIKRISLALNADQDIRTHKVFREIVALTSMRTKHVVRYITCWTEREETARGIFDAFSVNSSVVSESLEDSVWSDDTIKIALYIQMEYCNGNTLQSYLADMKRQISKSEVLNIFRQILKGVYHIHNQGLIHRDLKPANIFLGQGGMIKIGDFGLAVNGCVPHMDMTQPINYNGQYSIGIGTPTYSAPEVLSSRNYDSKVDVYSLGLILLELCSCFRTNSERIQAFRMVKQGALQQILSEVQESGRVLQESTISKFVREYPEAAALVDLMTTKDPSLRPSINEILGSEVMKAWGLVGQQFICNSKIQYLPYFRQQTRVIMQINKPQTTPKPLLTSLFHSSSYNPQSQPQWHPQQAYCSAI